MTHQKSWKRKLKKNWKTWLLSLFMALILLSGGVSTILRVSRSAARQHPAPTVTATATLTPTPTATAEFGGIQLTVTPTKTSP